MPDDHGDDTSVARRLWSLVRCSFRFVHACEEALHGPCSFHSSCPAFDNVVADKDVRKNELFSPSTEFIVRVFSDEELQDTPGKERDVALVETYTADSQLFREMNRAMREKDVATMRFFASFIKEFRGVFKVDSDGEFEKESLKLTPFVGLAWRSILVKDLATELKKYRGYLDTKECISWPGFTSVSRNERQARSFGNITFVIRCGKQQKKGYHAYLPADISEHSSFKHEEEVVFPPFTHLQVLEVAEAMDSWWTEHKNATVSCQVIDFDGSAVDAPSLIMPRM